MNRQSIHVVPPGEKPPYSDAVLVGETLYIAGCIGFNPGTWQVPSDPANEARNLLNKVGEALAAAEMRMDNLVQVTIYGADLSLFDTFNAVYREYLGPELPARAFIGAGPLLFGGRFQFQGIAVKS
jgi:enamine deaminase RidA (YjgF/YER057c/UK114 family)